jgi:HD-like signal output (HDOD) protein
MFWLFRLFWQSGICMANKLSDWIKAFSNCEIPVLYQSKRRIHELQEDEQDITVTVLADIARQDPGFSIHLLRHVGRASKKEITSIYHAITLISIPIVIKMLTDLPTLEKVLDNKTISTIIHIYAYQHQTAYMAKQWSILRKESENNELFTAGLNRSFFSFMLHVIDSDMAKQIDNIYFSATENYLSKEKELLGNSVDEISEAIAKHWRLPELICGSYSGKHHNPKITGIRLATELMHEIYSRSSTHYTDNLINRVAEYMRVSVERAPGKVNRIIISTIRDSQKYLPYQPLLLIMMSYPSSIIKEKNEIKAKTKEIKSTSSNTVFPECIELLREKKSSKSVPELIEITIKAMKDGIGFSRVLFMPFDKKEKCLNVKFQLLDNELPSLKQLKISMDLNKLFNQLLMKEQTLCINPKNQHKFIESLPSALRPMKSSATIIVNSFYINNKATGCFYVDYGNTDKLLSTNDLKLFKVICTELKTAIESTLIKKNSVKKVA